MWLGAQGKAEQQLGGAEWLGRAEQRLGRSEQRLGRVGEAAELCGAAELLGAQGKAEQLGGAERRLGRAERRLGGAGEAAELLGVPLIAPIMIISALVWLFLDSFYGKTHGV